MKMDGEQIIQITIVEKILRSLTTKFDYIVYSIEESNDVTTLSVDELRSSLMVYEQRMKGHKEEQQDLKITYDGRNSGRGRQLSNNEMIECFHLGIFLNECHSLEASYA